MGFLKELCVWGGLNMCQYVYAYIMYYILLENPLDSFVWVKKFQNSFTQNIIL